MSTPGTHATGYNLSTFGAGLGQLHWAERLRIRVWYPFYLLMLYRLRVENETSPSPFQKLVYWFSPVIILTIFFAGTVATALLWAALARGLWSHVVEALKADGSFLYVFAAVCLFATGAYCLRRWFRAYYGLGELAFGVMCIWYGLTEAQAATPADSRSYLATVAGIYVVVRALDNFFEGLKEVRTVILGLLGPQGKPVAWPAGPPQSTGS